MANEEIEVFEWVEGQPRPKWRPLERLRLPEGELMPQAGNLLWFPLADDEDADEHGFVPFVVVERGFLWGPRKVEAEPDPDVVTPLRWIKAFLLVRRTGGK
jgi:hypothetical protein